MTKKLLNSLSQMAAKNITKTICEALAKCTEMAANAIKSSEPKMFIFLNAVVAALLTYRFASKNKEKFAYIRGIAADKIGTSLLEVIDGEAKKMGKAND